MRVLRKSKFFKEKFGLVRDLNPGPLAPEARIIPLDQRAARYTENISLHELLTLTVQQLKVVPMISIEYFVD